MDKKGKLAQRNLDLYDPSVQQEHGGDIDFVLKIHDGHLHDLEISSVANLLSALGQIVGIKQANSKVLVESINKRSSIPTAKSYIVSFTLQKHLLQQQIY